ncbi:MAG: hypothetical protein HS128_19150 [Ideonella sp.]|nr:hypothetical protein [Ideonella sp.]MCC7455992.1 hypothetical protein [Nitrospira sp.]
MHYTPAQTRWFLQAVARAEAAAQRNAVVAARVAQAADHKAVQRYLDALGDETDGG